MVHNSRMPEFPVSTADNQFGSRSPFVDFYNEISVINNSESMGKLLNIQIA